MFITINNRLFLSIIKFSTISEIISGVTSAHILARMTEKTSRTNGSLNPILLVSTPKTHEAVLQIYAWSKIYAF